MKRKRKKDILGSGKSRQRPEDTMCDFLKDLEEIIIPRMSNIKQNNIWKDESTAFLILREATKD